MSIMKLCLRDIDITKIRESERERERETTQCTLSDTDENKWFIGIEQTLPSKSPCFYTLN
jgi:hypothetical protein